MHRNRKYASIETSGEVSLRRGCMLTHKSKQTNWNQREEKWDDSPKWMKEKRDHLWFPLLLPTVILDSWQTVCHRPQDNTCRLLFPVPNVSQSLSLLFSFDFTPLYVCVHPSLVLFLFLSPPLSSLIFLHLFPPEFPTLTKPCKTFHSSTTRLQLTGNVKSLFLWHWSNVSPVFPQTLLNPCLALRGPARPFFTPCTLLWFTSAV